MLTDLLDDAPGRRAHFRHARLAKLRSRDLKKSRQWEARRRQQAERKAEQQREAFSREMVLREQVPGSERDPASEAEMPTPKTQQNAEQDAVRGQRLEPLITQQQPAEERVSGLGGSETPVTQQRRLQAELRRAREQSGMTQRDVAQALDWSPSKVIRLERGGRVSAHDVRKFARFVLPRRKIRARNTLAVQHASPWVTYRCLKPPGRLVMASSRPPRGPNGTRMTSVLVMRGVQSVRD